MQKSFIEKLAALARDWDERAMEQVPAAYADRGLHHKYLRLDNEAAGLSICADELHELLALHAVEHSTQPSNGDGTPEPANNIAEDRPKAFFDEIYSWVMCNTHASDIELLNFERFLRDFQTRYADAARHSVGG